MKTFQPARRRERERAGIRQLSSRTGRAPGCGTTRPRRRSPTGGRFASTMQPSPATDESGTSVVSHRSAKREARLNVGARTTVAPCASPRYDHWERSPVSKSPTKSPARVPRSRRLTETSRARRRPARSPLAPRGCAGRCRARGCRAPARAAVELVRRPRPRSRPGARRSGTPPSRSHPRRSASRPRRPRRTAGRRDGWSSSRA